MTVIADAGTAGAHPSLKMPLLVEPLAVAAPLLYNRKRVCKMCVKFPISCWFSTWQITNRNANAFIATRNSRINAQPENIT
jgi:hypothetical protein